MTESRNNALLDAQSADLQTDSQRSAGDSPSLLGTTYKVSVPRTNENQSAEVFVYALQSVARQLLPDRRVAWCMRRFQPQRDRIEIVHSPKRQSAYYYGLMRCSKLWECPVCARKITERRRKELVDLLNAASVSVLSKTGRGWVNVPKFNLSMLTFTIGHAASEPCSDVLDRLSRSYARFASGRWYQGFKQVYFVVGTLRALELTHGDRGWHPHYHVLCFHDSYLPTGRNYDKAGEEDTELVEEWATLGITREDFLQAARIRWTDSVKAEGGYTDMLRGVDLVVGQPHKYVAKVAGDRDPREWDLPTEVTKQPVKRARDENRTLIQLLHAYANGDTRAGDLWIEGIDALAGKSHLRPSKGLWDMLNASVTIDDEQASEQEIDEMDRVLASLNWEDWKRIIARDARGQVLEVASNGSDEDLWRLLESFGIHRQEGNND